MAVRIHKKDGTVVTVPANARVREKSLTLRTKAEVLSDGGALARQLREALDRTEQALKAVRRKAR